MAGVTGSWLKTVWVLSYKMIGRMLCKGLSMIYTFTASASGRARPSWTNYTPPHRPEPYIFWGMSPAFPRFVYFALDGGGDGSPPMTTPFCWGPNGMVSPFGNLTSPFPLTNT